MSGQRETSTTISSRQREMERRVAAMTSAVLSELRLDGTLCDVVIKVDGVEFCAHKIILSGCSAYFRTLFTGAWATPYKQIYTIPGLSHEMMQLIINYAYTNSVTVTEENVVEVLAAADQFLVPGMVQICCFFLEEQLCLSSCISIWRLVDFYHCPELRQKVFLYILHHFEEVINISPEYLELSVQQLAPMIESDHLNVKQERTVFTSVLRWINHQPDQRQGHLSVLLSKVRFGFMSFSYFLYNVIDHPLIQANIERVPIIDDAVTAFSNLRAKKNSPSVYSNLITRPRLPSSLLLVIGGKDGPMPAKHIEVYDSRADNWVSMTTEEIWRAHHGTAVLDNYVYLIGGCSHEAHLNSVQKFDLSTYTWHQVTPMISCRCHVSVAVENGCIYAMGGFSGHSYLNTVECYKPETNRWTLVAPMHSKRCSASSTALHGKVYICGGFNRRRSLSTAEFYNPDTDQWTSIAAMTTCRSGLGVIAYKGCIYAIGGTINGMSPLCTAEVYNTQTNRWHSVPPMRFPRSYFGIAVVDDQLFVVGGFDGSSAMGVVEYFDDEASLWYVASRIEMSRSGLSCCVLHGLYSVTEKLFPHGPLTPPKMEEAAEGPSFVA